MKLFCFLLVAFLPIYLNAQSAVDVEPTTFTYSQNSFSYSGPFIPKLYQRNTGALLGVQRGQYTFIEMGGEAHWRKIGLKKSNITATSVTMEYNPLNHVIGYKAGMWTKRGHVNLSYGGNLVFYNDFKGKSRYGLGPAVGFRLAGFHLINGYNFLAGNKELSKVNTLYIALRYYFPVNNKFTWDRTNNNNRDKAKKSRENEKKKRQRMKEKERKKIVFPFLKN